MSASPTVMSVGAVIDVRRLVTDSVAGKEALAKLKTLQEQKVAEARSKQEAIDVTLSRPTHTVTVTSNPSGATIFIDGRRAGTTPTKLSVLGFVTLKLEFKKTGYAPKAEKFYSRYAVDKVNVKLTKW